MKLDAAELEAVLKRLKRAQGQLSAVVKMIEDERDCREVFTQLAAVSKAIDRAGFALVSSSLQQCIASDDTDDSDVAALEKLFLSLA